MNKVFSKLSIFIFTIFIAFKSNALDIIPAYPDPCTMNTHQREVQIDLHNIRGYKPIPQIKVYGELSVLAGLPGTADVAVIVNGNGYHSGNYHNIADFLAHNGFLTVVAARPGDSWAQTDPTYVIDVLKKVFSEYSLDPNSKVALIGHSVGGGVVNNAAIENYAEQEGFKIRSVVNVAPNVNDAGDLNGYHTSSFLALYGSRDRDMGGTAGTPREGFAAYDKTGTEGTTTCSSPPCWAFMPMLEKTMAFAHGADHAEFVGTSTKVLGNVPDVSYLSSDDQFCIGKGYINAFLRYHMRGESVYKGFLRDEWRPLSFLMIDSDDSDDLGEPAGTDLRLYNQFSPKQKQSLENFEDGQYSMAYKSADVVLQQNNEGGLNFSPYRVRHLTRSLSVGWPQKNSYQYLAFNVPANYRNASTFTDLSIRIGQLRGAPVPYSNNNNDESMWIGLRDKNNVTRWERLHVHGKIPRTDRHTAMNTIAIPLSEFNGLDMSDIRRVYFAFYPNSSGTVILDNIEWLRD
ncbi:MAG: alpha/beta hydrolase [Kangiellaceae bacterium]|nr:alpha/beta hydrolase [Kangiellaceae bacterium]MCW8998801.1 alpha/beta hydrolase [Kangiellaceae bacterium]